MAVVLERRRSGWDIALGALLAILGLVILGHAVIATAVSVLFIGWMALIGGVATLIASLFRIGKGGFWFTALTGALLTALGLMIVRNPQEAAFTLTLVAGVIFLAGGVMRLAASTQVPDLRWPLVISGVVSAVLGLMVLFNLYEATYVLLGVLLGVQTVVDGFTLMLVGRMRVVTPEPTALPSQSRREPTGTREERGPVETG